MDDRQTPSPMVAAIAALERLTDEQFDQIVSAVKDVGRPGAIAALKLIAGVGPAFGALANPAGPGAQP